MLFCCHIRNEKTIIKEIKSESGNECGNVKNVNAWVYVCMDGYVCMYVCFEWTKGMYN